MSSQVVAWLASVPATSHSEHHTSRLGLILAGIFLIAVGGFHVFKPDLSWRMSRWQYKNRDTFAPSAAGLIAIRLGGVVALGLGIFILIKGLV